MLVCQAVSISSKLNPFLFNGSNKPELGFQSRCNFFCKIYNGSYTYFNVVNVVAFRETFRKQFKEENPDVKGVTAVVIP